MATWLGVAAAALVVASLMLVTAQEEPRAVGEFVAVHRHFPRVTHVMKKEQEIGHAAGDGKRMQWSFNPFNPVQTFGVRREGHGHTKCGMAAKMGSWWSTMFAHHRDHDYELHHDEEHRREHDHKHRFEEPPHKKHHHRYGWGLLRKIGRWFSGIPSIFSDLPNLIVSNSSVILMRFLCLHLWKARIGYFQWVSILFN